MWDKRTRMNNDKSGHKKTGGSYCAVRYLGRAVSLVLLLVSLNALAANEQTLAVLKVGDRIFHDVRVRTKAKDYVFIAHSSGLTSIKVAELPADVREQLGYASETKSGAALIQSKVANQGGAAVGRVEAELSQAWQRTGLGSVVKLLRTYRAVAAVIAVLLHVFCTYCCLLICQKTGKNPGKLVWLPVLQAVPMLRAASMSMWWFAALFIPGLNLWAWGLWCVKIVRARQKTMPLAILLMFPLTSWFGFLFLAFSEDSRDREKVRVEAVTLESVLSSVKRSGATAFLRRERHIVA